MIFALYHKVKAILSHLNETSITREPSKWNMSKMDTGIPGKHKRKQTLPVYLQGRNLRQKIRQISFMF